MKCKWHDCFTCPYEECIDETNYNKDACRRYYEKNKERRILYQLAYNKAHIEQKRANDKRYFDTHKEQRKEYDHQRWLKRKADRQRQNESAV